MKTMLHVYRYDLDSEEDRASHEELTRSMRADGVRLFNAMATTGKRSSLKSGEVEICTGHLFSDQWNTVDAGDQPGHRVFDWYEDIYPNVKIKEGHWLELTDEMKEARRQTFSCGYCGKQEPAAKGYVFCPHCLDSEHLKKGDLHLTRMLPVELHFPKREELTEAELANLFPQYIKRQTTGSDSRNAKKLRKQRSAIIKKQSRAAYAAKTEADGLLWLMAHDVSIDNVIYYSHTDKFCFGWRGPVSDEVARELLGMISEFEHAYEIRGETRNWEGY